MLITVPIEELLPGDLLPDDIGAPVSDGERVARRMIRDAMDVPARTGGDLYQRARTVREVRKVGKLYAHVTMGTYAVVSLRKGSPVSVYRNEPNGPQDGSQDVPEATEPEATPEREPFNYVTSQFRSLGTVENAGVYKLQIFGENGKHTKWLSVHPDDMAEIQEILESRERQG